MNYQRIRYGVGIVIVVSLLLGGCKGKRFHRTTTCEPFEIAYDAKPAGFQDTDYKYTIRYQGDKIPLGDFMVNPVPYDTPVIVRTRPAAILLSLVKHYNSDRELVLLTAQAGHPHFVTLHRNNDYYGMNRAIQQVDSGLLLTGNKLLDKSTLKIYDLPVPDKQDSTVHTDFFGLSPDRRVIVRGFANLKDGKLYETEFATGNTQTQPVDTLLMKVPVTNAGNITMDTAPLQAFLDTYFEWVQTGGQYHLQRRQP